MGFRATRTLILAAIFALSGAVAVPATAGEAELEAAKEWLDSIGAKKGSKQTGRGKK